MDLITLSRLGGRHLVTLHVLLDSQSVTRSAERLFTTPSSVSKTLNQLRELLSDQLLYRQGNQLKLTPFAERIAPNLHRLLNELSSFTATQPFSPRHWQGSLRLGMRESAMNWPVGPILAALMQEVPGMVPEIWNKDQQGLEALALGKLDFVILPHDQSQPPFQQAGLTWLPLRREKLVCLLRHDHPALREPWHLDTYLSWRHIAIRDNELANPFFEQHLAQQRVHRQIGAVLPDFASAAALLPHSDLILTALAGWAENMAKHSTLALRAAPFEYGHISYSLVFCEPQREGSAMAWFKKRFVSLATQLTP